MSEKSSTTSFSKTILFGAVLGIVTSLLMVKFMHVISIFEAWFIPNPLTLKIVGMIVSSFIIWASAETTKYDFVHGFFSIIMSAIWITVFGLGWGIGATAIWYILIGYIRSQTHPSITDENDIP